MNLPALLAAIAIVESADKFHPQGNDLARGRKGEVSRYQIMPSTWRRFGGGAMANAKDPVKSKAVALRIVKSFHPTQPTTLVDDEIRSYAMQWNPTWLGKRSGYLKFAYCLRFPNCYPNRVLREYHKILAKEKRK